MNGSFINYEIESQAYEQEKGINIASIKEGAEKCVMCTEMGRIHKIETMKGVKFEWAEAEVYQRM